MVRVPSGLTIGDEVPACRKARLDGGRGRSGSSSISTRQSTPVPLFLPRCDLRFMPSRWRHSPWVSRADEPATTKPARGRTADRTQTQVRPGPPPEGARADRRARQRIRERIPVARRVRARGPASAPDRVPAVARAEALREALRGRATAGRAAAAQAAARLQVKDRRVARSTPAATRAGARPSTGALHLPAPPSPER